MDKNKCPFFLFGMEKHLKKHEKYVLDDNAVKNEHCMILLTASFFYTFHVKVFRGFFRCIIYTTKYNKNPNETFL